MTTTKKPRRMARPQQIDSGENINAGADVATNFGPTGPMEMRVTKLSMVIELLHREGGTSLAEIVKATDWLPHTARAALTGLRKKGHAIARSSVDGETRYAIVAAATE